MFRGTIFWVIMLILLLAIIAGAAGFLGGPLLVTFNPVITWILLALLGWAVFGAMIK